MLVRLIKLYMTKLFEYGHELGAKVRNGIGHRRALREISACAYRTMLTFVNAHIFRHYGRRRLLQAFDSIFPLAVVRPQI